LQLHFQATPWDLYACFAYTLAVLTILLGLGVGGPVAILLVFLLPGYVTIASIYPFKDEIGWAERSAYSLVLSLVLVPLLGLVLNVLGIGIRFVPVALATTSYVIFVGILAYVRRIRIPVEKRLSGRLELGWPQGAEYSAMEKTVTIALVISVILAAAVVAYIASPPHSSEQFTEFFILGSSGNASGYPAQLNVSETGTVIISVVNHEYAGFNYTVRVDLVGIGITYNASAKSNQTVELNRTTWSWFNLSLANGQRWIRQYPFSIQAKGLWKVQFLLFKDGDGSTPYRKLGIYVDVN
jgi:uncharacterized membrane protein